MTKMHRVIHKTSEPFILCVVQHALDHLLALKVERQHTIKVSDVS